MKKHFQLILALLCVLALALWINAALAEEEETESRIIRCMEPSHSGKIFFAVFGTRRYYCCEIHLYACAPESGDRLH